MKRQIDNKTYVYVFVRRDIPLEHQIVQSAHAALESGLRFKTELYEPSSLIMIGVKNQSQLEKARLYVNEKGVQTEMFFEPSWDYGNTAFATEAVTDDLRHIFKRYQLWKV